LREKQQTYRIRPCRDLGKPIILTFGHLGFKIFPIMASSELLIDNSVIVDYWVKTHIRDITSAMKQAQIAKATEDIIGFDVISEQLRTERRTYSEMPICDDVWKRLDPPPGFEIVPWSVGRVNIVGTSTGLVLYSINHAYVINPHGVILCITPGQFESFMRTDLYAGDRLQRLKNKAPDLISLYPDDRKRLGIGILFGPREEIAQKLNFDYTTVG